MNMTSNCDVTKSAHPIQMTTICHWMIAPWNFLGTPLISVNIAFHSWWRMNRNVLGAWNDAYRISARWQLYDKQMQYHMGYWNMLVNEALKGLFPSKCFFSNLYHYLLGLSTFWRWNSKLFHTSALQFPYLMLKNMTCEVFKLCVFTPWWCQHKFKACFLCLHILFLLACNEIHAQCTTRSLGNVQRAGNQSSSCVLFPRMNLFHFKVRHMFRTSTPLAPQSIENTQPFWS